MISMKNVLLCSILVTAIALVSLPEVALAQVGVGQNNAKQAAGQAGLSQNEDIKAIILAVINFILGLVGVIAVLALIIAGITYITSFGDEKKAETAKRTILYVVIGLILIILAGVIVNLVLSTLRK